jgi:hypothetical protein
MNNPAVNIQPSQLMIVTRKVLVQAANQFMANSEGVYSQEDVFNAVAEIAEIAQHKTLITELSWSVAREVIKRRSTPRLTHSEDWVGYGETAINLPESMIVNIYHAGKVALDHRASNVIDNRDRIIAAANEELSRINKVQDMMQKMGFVTAGPALDVLSAA